MTPAFAASVRRDERTQVHAEGRRRAGQDVLQRGGLDHAARLPGLALHLSGDPPDPGPRPSLVH